MINSKLRQILLVAGESALLTLITAMSVLPVSCKITEQGVKILDGDYEPPVLNDFSVTDGSTLKLVFSEKIEVAGYVVTKVTDESFASEEHSETLDLSPALENISGVNGSIPCTVNSDETGSIVQVVFESPMEIGQKYELYAQIDDCAGNSLTIAIPFTGFNSRVPELLITEIQTESVSQNKSEKTDGTYRSEFVEILVLKSGNLAGLELCSGYDGEDKKFVFPILDVNAGEVFVVHMRNRGNGCISELDDDLSKAFTSYSKPNIRDLFTDVESTTLGNKTDVIILRNSADNKLLDAAMFRAADVEAWTGTMNDYSLAVEESGIYESGGVENAFVTDGMTASKTMVRTDAASLKEKVVAGEQIEFPVHSKPELWQIISAATPGEL